jgi:hypothetical protein
MPSFSGTLMTIANLCGAVGIALLLWSMFKRSGAPELARRTLLLAHGALTLFFALLGLAYWLAGQPGTGAVLLAVALAVAALAAARSRRAAR